MLTFENQNIEFQQEYVPDIRKEVIGFAMQMAVPFMSVSVKMEWFWVFLIQMV